MDVRIIALNLAADQDVVSARQRARQIAVALGFAAQDQTRIATAVSEIARNAFRYASGGRIEFSLGSPRARVQRLGIVVTDRGGGITDLPAVLEGRYRSATGMGMGLVGSRRLMDEFDIATGPAGTKITMAKYLPHDAPKVAPAAIAALAGRLTSDPLRDALAEVQQQNRELMQALRDLQEQHEELLTVTAQARTLARSLQDADVRKDEFLATLAHELRNPLAPIRNSAAYLQAVQPQAEEKVAKAHAVIARQATHLTRLVDDLLDVARISRGKIEMKFGQIELGLVVQAAVETIEPFLQARGQRLLSEIPAAPVLVTGDSVRLAQVVANLLHNAGKYSPPQAEIGLAITQAGPDRVQITVSDKGIGLSPEALANVFDIFVQAGHSPDLPQTGLGIGLSLVRGLVEMHGGSVQAMSQGVGHGATFVITLPTVSAQAAAPAAAPAAAGSAKRILVVDDNEDAADSIAMLLELFGHEVRTANLPDEALLAVRSFAPQVVLLDIGLPGRDGYTLIGELAPLVPAGALFIAMTGYGQERDRQKAHEAGFHHHLTKPVDMNILNVLLK